jgi:hypothetical protein
LFTYEDAVMTNKGKMSPHGIEDTWSIAFKEMLDLPLFNRSFGESIMCHAVDLNWPPREV